MIFKEEKQTMRVRLRRGRVLRTCAAALRPTQSFDCWMVRGEGGGGR